MPSNQANLAQIEQKRAQLEIIIAKIPDLSGYTMRFVILTRDASAQKKSRRTQSRISHSDRIRFEAKRDILDLSDFVRAVNNLDDSRLQKLDCFMEQNANPFIQRMPAPRPKSKVDAVIDEYSNNFESPLFRHIYIQDTKVRLCNLYVDPAYCEVDKGPSRDIGSLFTNSCGRILFQCFPGLA